MANEEITDPVCIEVATHWSIDGKVAIKEFGKISSGWSGSMSRRFVIPSDWTQEQIDEFHLEQRQHLEDLLEPIDQHHFDERYEQRDW